MNAIKKIFLREAGILLNDRDILIITLIVPLTYVIFYGSLYYYKTQTKEPVVIVDRNHSALSRSFIRDIDANEYASVVRVTGDMEQARDMFYRGNAQAIVQIPENFEQDIESGKGTTVPAYLNTSRFLIANDLNKALSQVAFTFGDGVQITYFESRGANMEQSMRLVEPLRLDFRPMFNTSESYGNFILPGLLPLILCQALLFALSESFSRERETKSLGELYKMSGENIRSAIFGKGAFYLVFFSAFSLFTFVIYFSFFKLNMNGNMFALAVITLLALASVIFMGFFVSSFFREKIVSFQFLVFTSYPFFFITGLSWPTLALPSPIKAFALLLPTTPYLQSVMRLTQMGGSWSDVWQQLSLLVILCAGYYMLAHMRFRQLIKMESTSQV